MKEFSIKDLGEAKTIIGWEIEQDLQARILKINQKSYIYNLLEAKKMSSCHPIVFPIKVGFTLLLNQARDYDQSNLIIY